MNIEQIDKWLSEEYGCSYTRLEELHNYFFEKYTDQKEEIERLNNIINEIEKYLNNSDFRCPDDLYVSACDDALNKLQGLKGDDKE